jgi:O-antigen ligase
MLHAAIAVPVRRPFAERFWPVFIFFLMAVSSVVQREPAPYDFLLLGGMILFILSGARVPAGLVWPALSVVFLLLGYVVGAMFAVFQSDAFTYLRTSTYLSVSLLFFASLVWRAPERVVPVITWGLLIASLFAAGLGIAGYFNAIPDASSYAVYGRATGPFKDPNVFGPSLVFPTLFLVNELAMRRARDMFWILPPLLFLLLALFLSFSRGAWMNFIVAALVFLMLTAMTAPRGVRRRLGGFTVLLVIATAIGIAVALSNEHVRTLFIQRFALAQDYDAAEGGRFDNMFAAFMTALSHPWGIGPDQWPHMSTSQLMPHNIYVNVFVSGGILSLIGFAGLTVSTLWTGFAAIKRNPPMAGVLAAAIGAFAGHALEGFIIDSNHWRHIYVLVGIIWGLALAARTGAQARLIQPAS